MLYAVNTNKGGDMATKKTRTIACRVPINIYNRVVLYAKDRDITVSDWLKPIIIRAVYPGKKGKPAPSITTYPTKAY